MNDNVLKKDYVRKDIVFRILSGQYSLAGRIPPERELSKSLNVSRMTVHKAIDDLMAEGILIRKGRNGTLVNKIPERSVEMDSKTIPRILFIYFSSIKGHPVEKSGASARLYHGIELFAEKHNMSISVQSGENFLRNPMLSHDAFDGIIASGSQLETHWRKITGSGLPVVVAGSTPRIFDVDIVCGDRNEIGFQAAKAVLENGCKNPLSLIIRYENEDFIQPNFITISRAFHESINGTDVSINEYIIDYKDFIDHDETLRKINDIILEKDIDCIIDYSDFCNENDFPNLPLISTSGFNKMMLREKTCVSICVDAERIGYLATECLFKRIQNPCLENIRILIPAKVYKTGNKEH
ncbi:MAG: GntR family transcriptional regulator [Victivallales bacterium]|nr:GntR family transcriptional regulator [Victivallales bacterium]